VGDVPPTRHWEIDGATCDVGGCPPTPSEQLAGWQDNSVIPDTMGYFCVCGAHDNRNLFTSAAESCSKGGSKNYIDAPGVNQLITAGGVTNTGPYDVDVIGGGRHFKARLWDITWLGDTIHVGLELRPQANTPDGGATWDHDGVHPGADGTIHHQYIQYQNNQGQNNLYSVLLKGHGPWHD